MSEPGGGSLPVYCAMNHTRRAMTELIWDGKYDKEGKRVAPLRGRPRSTQATNMASSNRSRHLLGN
jgi:hypothetical protein